MQIFGRGTEEQQLSHFISVSRERCVESSEGKGMGTGRESLMYIMMGLSSTSLSIIFMEFVLRPSKFIFRLTPSHLNFQTLEESDRR